MRVERKQLRKFGLLVGGILVAYAGVKIWRHGIAPLPGIFGGVGALLVVSGALAPALLGPLYLGWMKLASVLGWVNTRILLGVIFFVVLTPISLILRLVGRDPLQRARRSAGVSYWFDRTETVDSEQYKRQF